MSQELEMHKFSKTTLTDSETSNLLAWIIWTLSALFYFYEFFLQVSPSVMSHNLMASFSIDGAQVGNLAAIYFYAFAAMQIPVGMLLDRFGPRKLLTIAALGCGIGNIVFASASVLWQAEVGRLIIGLGSAFSVVSCLKLAANWFPVRRFAFLTGLMLTIGMLGALFGEAPLSLLVQAIGWRDTMWLLACAGIILSALIFLIVRDRPERSKVQYSGLQDQSHNISMSFKQLLLLLKGILTKKQNWYTALYGGLMFAPTSAFAALWGVSFFVAKYHMDRFLAATMISVIFVGWVVGSPLIGNISDRIQRRKPPLYMASVGSIISIYFVIYVSMPIWLLCIALFCFGFFTSGFLPAFSIMRESNPQKANATALGFMNGMNMVGGAVLQPLIGWLLDEDWHHKVSHGVMNFSPGNYEHAMIVLPLCLLASLLFLPLIKETHGKVIVGHKFHTKL